jgi:hypothetical protein
VAFEDEILIDKRLARIQERLDRLDAERAIAHTMYRYIYACDQVKDAGRVASFFTEDAVWEGRGNFSEFGRTVGRQAIYEMFVENPRILPFTAHFLTNPVIGLAQDRRHGWGEWHVLEACTFEDNSAQVWIGARYDNDFRLEGSQWLIHHLRFTDTFVVPYEEGWLKTRYVSPLTKTKFGRL